MTATPELHRNNHVSLLFFFKKWERQTLRGHMSINTAVFIFEKKCHNINQRVNTILHNCKKKINRRTGISSGNKVDYRSCDIN